MTILIVLLGLLISHLVFPVARLRNFSWLLAPIGWVRRRFEHPDWAVAAAVIGVSLAVALGLNLLATGLAGAAGWFLMALAIFVYTLGPRDLDRDVQALRIGGNDTRYLKARRAMRIRSDAGAPEVAASIFHAGLTRWFGILFWFVVLGVPGALLYRLTRVSLNEPGLTPAQAGWVMRLRSVLDWPVLALMLISAALGGDYDRVRSAWRTHRAGRPAWALSADVLDDVAAGVVDGSWSFDEGLDMGHQMVWRMLLIWLVVLSLLLIVGWLS